MDKVKTVFKDNVLKPSSGSSDLEGATPIRGDFEVNGNKVVIVVIKEGDHCPLVVVGQRR